ncbi:MAG: hypothetical protein U5J95_02185 [Balneolaceae bacterium]|nr:hypothetical protein [Balneolaceae bacterium]
MEEVIIVEEKYSKYWIWAILLSSAIALALFIYSYSTGNVVIENYLQLGAFISFAITIFSVIKLWEGKKSIRMTFENENLVVDIFKNKDTLQQDRYELNKVKSIYLIPSRVSIPFLNISIDRKDAATFQLSLDEEQQPIYLFQFSGRIISVSNDAAKRLSAFLEEQSINVITSKQ